MNVEDAIRVEIKHGLLDEAHESSKADDVDVEGFELLGEGLL